MTRATIPDPATGRVIGKTRRKDLPPGPKLPPVLQAVAWARRPLAYLERCQKQFGDTFTIRVRHAGTWVILADPEDVKSVFTTDHMALGVGLANSVLGPLLGPRSVMLLEEPEHVRRRRLMLPPFHGERMKGYAGTMAEITRRELAQWPLGEPFELWPRMQEITLEAIVRVVFGPLDTPELEALRRDLRRLTNWMNDPRRLNLLAAAGPARFAGNRDYRQMMEPVERAVLAQVRRRQRDPDCTDGSDIAAMLGQARYEDGAPMSEQDLRDELVTLLTDGPTSSLLSWAFERLLRHPRVYARLQAEIDTVRSREDGEAQAGSGAEAPYLDAVVKETMRLCPAAPIVVRRLLEPMVLGGYELAAGSTVAPCVHLMHRNPTIYPEPLKFRPERFLERPAGTYTWIPFGGGVRRCLAAPYAQLLMKQVIRTVLAELSLQAVEPRSERARKSAIAFVPHRHALAIARRREVRAEGGRFAGGRGLASIAATLIGCLALSACGGAAKEPSSGSTAAQASTTPGAANTAAKAAQASRYSKLDRDNDNDNASDSYYDEDDNVVLDYGQNASAADLRAIASVVTRYYRAAAAADGARACSLTNPVMVEAIARERAAAASDAHSTCAAAQTALFRLRRRQIQADQRRLRVSGARVEGARAWALLRFGAQHPPGRILVRRVGSNWTVNMGLRIEMP